MSVVDEKITSLPSLLLGHHASPITKLYHFVDQKMNWTDAQRHCREQFDDLATVDNLEELKWLQESTSGFSNVDNMWIGLYDDLNRWQWSHGNQDYKMGQHYGNWRPGEPDYMNAKENCTMMTKSTGQWVDSACNLPLSAVCCNDEGNIFYVPNQMTWYDARQYCQSNYTELASVSDVTENGKIFAHLKSDAWIGLHRHPWSHWSDGSRATYWHWPKDQPNNYQKVQRCVAIEVTPESFKDEKCGTLFNFACQERQKQRSTFRLKISSEADMTDPEVQRQLLEQVGHHASPITKLYHFVDQKMNWTDAQRHCREQFDDLATVDNLEELKRLQESKSGFNNVGKVWIGLYDDLNRWQWSHGNQDYKMGQHYGNWRPGEPDYKNGKENCTMMTKSTGQWVDSACNLPLSAVCCNDEGNIFYVPNQMTWYDARQYCQSHYTELASVSDVTENSKIFALLESDAWIGLHRHPWSHWSDGSRATYWHWIKYQPNNFNNLQHCVMIHTSGFFNDGTCGALLKFACQERQKQHSTFRLKISSEADMMDPEVQRQLLEQLYAKLANKGVTGVLGHHASPITKLYHFVNQTMTWADAQRHCREQFDDLATVDNLEELKRLQESTSGFNNNGHMWIGLYDDLTRWQWSHGNQDYKMGQHYGNWAPSQPNFFNSEQNCTMMTKSTGQWNDCPCASLQSAVCCNDEGNFFYVPIQMTWYDARQYCQSHYTELASVSDVTENSKIFALLESDAWIGLHRHPWSHWSDGSRATYYNWLKDQPSNFNGEQYCAIMEFTTAGFRDKSCVILNYVACQERQKQRSTFRLKISSEADMTDPEVQRQLLEQVGRVLRWEIFGQQRKSHA
ncbi:Macrophage mannose receptor 1 [Merluccius polli]|uniref:Macrophage mannose receptor 1 n=1 Tax=Merluccius polli TaxID=89951 RepID=A0AA47M5M8_MERPO|nr:Macrophage mannose receptor 1 [Merluccius polli]